MIGLSLIHILVYPLLFLVFAGAMWLIFAPSSGGEEEEVQRGFNIDVPLPQEKGLLDDKKEAYERDDFEKQQKSKMGKMCIRDSDTVLAEHLERHKEEINELYRQKREDLL